MPNAPPGPRPYGEVVIHSGGAPIVLSIWHAHPSRATVVFLPGTTGHPLSYAEFPGGLSIYGFTWCS